MIVTRREFLKLTGLATVAATLPMAVVGDPERTEMLPVMQRSMSIGTVACYNDGDYMRIGLSYQRLDGTPVEWSTPLLYKYLPSKCTNSFFENENETIPTGVLLAHRCFTDLEKRYKKTDVPLNLESLERAFSYVLCVPDRYYHVPVIEPAALQAHSPDTPYII